MAAAKAWTVPDQDLFDPFDQTDLKVVDFGPGAWRKRTESKSETALLRFAPPVLLNERSHHGADLGPRFRSLMKDGVDGGDAGFEMVAEKRMENLVFGLEVMIEGRLRDPAVLRNFHHRDTIEAIAREEVCSAFEDQVALLAVVARSHPRHVKPRQTGVHPMGLGRRRGTGLAPKDMVGLPGVGESVARMR